MTRAADPQTSFADLEFFHQGVQLDPLLQAVSTFLDTQADLVERVRQDLERGLKQPQTGRRGVTPSQALRSLVLMRVKNWDYRELAERIADGYTLRGFTHFFSQRVPAHDAFHRACCRLTPEVLRAINDRVVHPRSICGSKMVNASAWIPRSSKRTSIIQPTTRCSGTWCEWSRGWSGICTPPCPRA